MDPVRRRVVNSSEQVLGSGPADILKAHVDAAERWLRAKRHRPPVVEADERYVLRDAAPEHPERRGDASRDLIATAEDGLHVGRSAKQYVRALAAPLLTPFAVEHIVWRELGSRGLDCVTEPARALARAQESLGPGDMADPNAAGFDEVASS